jgi:hypothetical protein
MNSFDHYVDGYLARGEDCDNAAAGNDWFYWERIKLQSQSNEYFSVVTSGSYTKYCVVAICRNDFYTCEAVIDVNFEPVCIIRTIRCATSQISALWEQIVKTVSHARIPARMRMMANATTLAHGGLAYATKAQIALIAAKRVSVLVRALPGRILGTLHTNGPSLR